MRYFTFCNFVKMTELWKNRALKAKEKIFSKNLKKFEKIFDFKLRLSFFCV